MFSHKPTIVLFVSDVISPKMCSNGSILFPLAKWNRGEKTKNVHQYFCQSCKNEPEI